MSARSTTTPSAWQMYCCLRRDLSVRCSMLKEMPEERAPENKRTGMEIKPKVKCPDQTEAAIVPLNVRIRACIHACHKSHHKPCPSDRDLPIPEGEAQGRDLLFL